MTTSHIHPPAHDTRSTRWHVMAGLVLVAVVVSACGGGNDSQTAEPSVTEPSAEAPRESGDLPLIPRSPDELGIPSVPAAKRSPADDAVSYNTAVEPYERYGTSVSPGVFPRTINHAMGTTTIETAPRRVVVLDVGELDSMVQVGIIPVGAVEYNSFGLPPFIVDQVEDVELVGTTSELNFEAITALRPDLILSSKLRHEEFYDLLSDIAPTVFADRPGVTFKQNFKLYAQAVGREAQAATVVRDYETKVQAVSAGLGENRPTVSIVQLRPDSIRFYLRANFLGVVLTDVGLPRSPAQNVDDFAFTLSEERLSEFVDGEAVIVAVVDDDVNGILDSPLWKSLPAVANDEVYDVDTRTWIGGVGYGSAFEVLDQLDQRLGRT